MTRLNDYYLAPEMGGVQTVVIFLHGLGDRGDGGLLEIGRLWAPFLPHTAFHCPDAPFAFDMAPEDFGGRQWFSLVDRTPSVIEAGVRHAAPILDGYLDAIQNRYNVSAGRVAFVGFSQGTMMALHVGLRRKEAPMAIIGYSGALVAPETLTQEITQRPPVTLVHGTADDVVPYAALAIAETALQKVHVPVTTVVCPHVGHTIDDRGIDAGLRALRAAIPL